MAGRSRAALATAIEVSELVIELTIVAGGTPVPEMATSIVAAMRGERNIAVANIVGSNTLSILGIFGLAAALAPSGLAVAPADLTFDIPVIIAVAVACLPLFFAGDVIARWEGAIFLGYYRAYTLYLVLRAVRHDSAAGIQPRDDVVGCALDLTVLTLGIGVVRSLQERRRSGGPRSTRRNRLALLALVDRCTAGIDERFHAEADKGGHQQRHRRLRNNGSRTLHVGS